MWSKNAWARSLVRGLAKTPDAGSRGGAPEPSEPLAIDLPETLHGTLVHLRPYQATDAEAVFAAIEESRAHLRPWVTWVDRFTSVEDTRAYCLRCATQWQERTDLAVGIFDALSGMYLGGAGLHRPDWEHRTFEVSCWLRASAAYQGFGPEALDLLGNLAFSSLDARQVKLLCDARNAATKRLAAKCGYVFRGSVRNGYVAPDGTLTDLLVYRLTPEDWVRIHPR
jgi:RimJ/RimL family protein N-acetyltransferase